MAAVGYDVARLSSRAQVLLPEPRRRATCKLWGWWLLLVSAALLIPPDDAVSLDCDYAIKLYDDAARECKASVQHEGVKYQPCEFAKLLEKNYLACTPTDEVEEDDESWFEKPQLRGPPDCPFAWGGDIGTARSPTACDDVYPFGVDSCEEIKYIAVDDRDLYQTDEVYRMAMKHRMELIAWCNAHIGICTANLQDKRESGQLRNNLYRNHIVEFDYGRTGQGGEDAAGNWIPNDPKKHGWKADCGYCPQFTEQVRRLPVLVFGLCVGENPLDLRER